MAIADPLTSHPALVRVLGGWLRRCAPILPVGPVVVVTRHADVREVLSRDKDFTIEEVNAAALDRISGPFVLGIDRSPHYERERAILQRCVHQADPGRIRAAVRATAAELIASAGDRGSFDVVRDYARPAAVRLAGDYLGVPGPDPVTMARWMRLLFHEAFLNTGGDPRVRRAAQEAADSFHAYADALIATRSAQIAAGTAVPDDFLTRLLHLRADPATRLGDEGVRRNLAGVVVGAVETTSTATARALAQLLRHRDALRRAGRAARDGDLDTVGGLVREAQRFHPLTAALLRHTARDTVLAAGTSRARRIPAGRRVLAGILPAMFDPQAFPAPGRLRADRPRSRYLTLGYGLHACFGRHVNDIQLTELIAALVREPGLRPVPGRRGRLVHDGPFPDRLLVDLG